jgi:hypothetical protein
MRSLEEIAALLDERSRYGRSRQAVMNEMAALYHGRITVPLPELGTEEQPAIANQVMQAIEQKAMRIASMWPVTRTFARSSQGSNGRKAAKDRKIAFTHFHESNGLERQMSVRARWMAAYSTAPVMILPDFVTEYTPRALGGPKWLQADPRGFYPHIDATDPTNPVKDDAVFHSEKTLGWLRRAHPDVATQIAGHNDQDTALVDWIVYIDHEQITTMVSRKAAANSAIADRYRDQMPPTDRRNAVVTFMENRVNEPLVVAPGGISLTMEPMGRYDQVVGMYRRMAELDALSRIALQKSIFSEAWAVSNPGEVARIEQRPEPLEGIPGKVVGGRMEWRQIDPQFATRIGVGDLERSIRLTGMIPAEFGGELPTNARTARQGGRLLSNAIDFDLAEVQKVLAESLEHENRLAALTDKHFFGGFTKTVEVDNGATQHDLTYDPAKLWTTVANKVSYALAGADADGTVIGAGQRMAMGTLAKRDFMEVDPMVRDVELTADRIKSEQIEEAFMSRLQQEATMDPAQSLWNGKDWARFAQLVESDDESPYTAYEKVNAEAQQRQAEAAQAQQPQGAAPVDPTQMPGISGADTPPAIAGPNDSQTNLTSLLGRLRLAQQTVPGEIATGATG